MAKRYSKEVGAKVYEAQEKSNRMFVNRTSRPGPVKETLEKAVEKFKGDIGTTMATGASPDGDPSGLNSDYLAATHLDAGTLRNLEALAKMTEKDGDVLERTNQVIQIARHITGITRDSYLGRIPTKITEESLTEGLSEREIIAFKAQQNAIDIRKELYGNDSDEE